MNLAFAALAGLQAVAELLGKPLRLPPISACEHQARMVKLPSSGILLVPDVDALRRKLQAAVLGGGFGNLSMQTLRQATAMLWSSPPFLAELPGLLPTLMQVAANTPRLLHALIEAWLRDFNPQSASFGQAGRDIAALLHQAQHPRLLPWAEAHRRFILFDTASGPTRVCEALLNGQEDVQQICAVIGMNDAIRANGECFRAVLLLS